MKYVSEEELRKWLITDGCEEGHGYIDEDDFVCMDWQDNPIKTGHWIFVDKAHEHAHCSKCDYGDVDLMDGRPHNYCPNCGAKMVVPQESEVDV